MTSLFADLPYPLDEIAELVGLETALVIADKVGGTRVSIPPRAREGHWLSEAVGLETARTICDHFRTLTAEGREMGVQQIIIPRGPTVHYDKMKVRFSKDREAGLSVRQIARKLGIHERTAFAWEKARKGGNQKELNQLSLFNG